MKEEHAPDTTDKETPPSESSPFEGIVRFDLSQDQIDFLESNGRWVYYEYWLK